MSSATSAWTFETTFSSDMFRAHHLIDVAIDELQRMDSWSDRELFAIRLALEEALINAVTHGNKSNPEKNVHFASFLSGDAARFRIEDEGPGFDPNAVNDPTDPEFIEIASGRGVLLIRGFMTQVKYNEKGNILFMEKIRGHEKPKTEEPE